MPMWYSVFLAPISEAFATMLEEFSFMTSRREYRDVNGWVYTSMLSYQDPEPGLQTAMGFEMMSGHGEMA